MDKKTNKNVKMYIGEVISEFEVRGGTGKDVKVKKYKMGNQFETEHKKVFDHLVNKHKIK